jgi:hypothetical protein
MTRGRLALALAATALWIAPSAAADTPQAAAIRQGLADAVEAGRISPSDAARDRLILARALSVLPRLASAQSTNLGAVIAEVAAQAPRYTAPRALTLFSMLDENTSYLGTHAVPGARVDVLAPDGVVYRFFPGRGLQFHPLAVFGALNAHLAAGRLDDARTLAESLLARAVPAGGGLTWEYLFPFAGGRPPWTSGMAQAVAAQALARAGRALGDPALTDAARKAYRAISGRLVRRLPAGPWIRLYAFNDDVVLNAQLQTALSLDEYAGIAGDGDAGALAASLERASATLLPRFDTGYWSLYSLAGDESPLEYHTYVISLLQRLATRTGNPVWSSAAARFQAYLTQPPVFELGPPSAALRRAGSARLSFWLSKRSSTVLRIGVERRLITLSGGWHAIRWRVSKPGVYGVSIDARDLAGNRASADLLPVVFLGGDG